MLARIFPALLIALLCAFSCSEPAPRMDFELRQGDRICLIGNTLADRMQHDGWLETLLQQRFADRALVFRNLGFSGDELTQRLRSANFGSPDDHLRRCRASVVFAFFGYNESFAGAAGLPKFESDLTGFIRHTREQKYDGAAAPRLVLFSPIAHENLRDPHLPDGAANNERLAAYTAAMRKVAAAEQVAFVDLLAPTQALYSEAKSPLTINGVHLTPTGNRRLAEIIDRALFGAAPPRDEAQIEKLRTAVLDKNLHWFNRYRTTDGFSIFGGRGGLQFVDGQTNTDVCNRELEILDVMTANRDARIQALARGSDVAVDDSNTPPFLTVKTNQPGKGEGSAHVFLGGEEAIAKMKVAAGMKVELFASEERFPELVNPQQSAVDPRGRLWVTAWPSYPHWQPKSPMNDKLLILPDEDRDGRADRCIVFAGDLHNPTGFEFWNGGVIVAVAPEILFLKDTDGDDRADLRVRLLSGIDSADTHHTANSFVLGPGGDLYFQEGTFHHTQVETPWGPPLRNANGAVFRYEPRTQKFESYSDYPFLNPHGHVFDRWGQDFVTDGTSSVPYGGASFSGRTIFPGKHRDAPAVFRPRTRPTAGTAILSSRHFPDELQGNWLVSNVIGFLGILQYRFADDGSGFTATEVEPIVVSSDPNFRPCDMEIGADGALYFTDWQNPIIGHMQHNLRDPSRDKAHGRVYRVTVEGRPLLPPVQIAGAPTAALVKLLETPEDSVRYRARIELSARPSDEVIAATKAWVGGLDADDADHAHHLTEALWVHQQHDVVDEPLLRRLLRTGDPRARAAATRVLWAWRDRIAEVLELLRVQVADEHPRVRLEAVRACSYLPTAEAAEVALLAVARPLDRFLSYTLGETMTTLKPQWSAAIAEGRPFAAGNDAGLAWILDQVAAADLAKLPRTEAVSRAMLTRDGVADNERRAALTELAARSNGTPLGELLTVLEAGTGAAALRSLLATWDSSELKTAADRIARLAAGDLPPATRSAAYAAWIRADGSAERAWQAAEQSGALADLLRAIPLIPERSGLAALHERIRPLLFAQARAENAAGVKRTSGVAYEHYEAERFPDVSLETLARLTPKSVGRLPVFTDEIAGRADAYALRLTASLNAPSAGDYVFWTRSDDGSRLYVDGGLVVDNDGVHSTRERQGALRLAAGPHRLVVTWFDNGGADELQVFWQGPDFARREIEAQALSIDAQSEVLGAAVAAVAALPGHEAEKFADFARLFDVAGSRDVAVQAMLTLPREHWPTERAQQLAPAVLSAAAATPLAARETPGYRHLTELGVELASALSAGDGDAMRAELADLSPLVIRLRAVPEKMIYDRKEFTVVAGKPVHIVFDNPDGMPHNLLVVRPGKIEAVGVLAEQLGPDGFDKHFRPASDDVLHATKLVQPGESATLTFTAPAVPGDYGYVCTFPGHWRLMNGVMHVVAAGK